MAEGGWPGGGAGHGGNPHWAAGGGGGYSMVAKKASIVLHVLAGCSWELLPRQLICFFKVERSTCTSHLSSELRTTDRRCADAIVKIKWQVHFEY